MPVAAVVKNSEYMDGKVILSYIVKGGVIFNEYTPYTSVPVFIILHERISERHFREALNLLFYGKINPFSRFRLMEDVSNIMNNLI